MPPHTHVPTCPAHQPPVPVEEAEPTQQQLLDAAVGTPSRAVFDAAAAAAKAAGTSSGYLHVTALHVSATAAASLGCVHARAHALRRRQSP